MKLRNLFIAALLASAMALPAVLAQEHDGQEQRGTYSKPGEPDRGTQDPRSRGQMQRPRGEGAGAAPDMNIRQEEGTFRTVPGAEGQSDWYNEDDPGVFSEEGGDDTPPAERR